MSRATARSRVRSPAPGGAGGGWRSPRPAPPSARGGPASWPATPPSSPSCSGAASEPLDIGRASRVIPPGLRRARITRDRGCSFPACRRPPRSADAHHIRHWADGGPTALNILVLLCEHHHDVIHHTDWQVTIEGGRPVFTPPPWLDPMRRPRPPTDPTDP